MQPHFDIIVVGGGAAGFFGALTAAQMNPELRIVILERGTKPLGKVLISGGGRCNVTHACFDPKELVQNYPRGSRELLGPFNRFQPADTIAWFEQRGVALKTEPDGRVFPVSDRSQSIIDCLLGEADRLGVRVLERCTAKRVAYDGEQFVVSGSFDDLTARNVLLAPGGNSVAIYESAARFGHTIVPPVPSLFTFNITDARIRELQGITVSPCTAALRCAGEVFEAEGPVLITHWGLSGPAILKLSAWGARALSGTNYRAELEINWLPGETTDAVYEFLLKLKNSQPRNKLPRKDPYGRLPARLWQSLVQSASGNEDRLLAETRNQVLRRLAEDLTQSRLEIRGKGVFKEEFVTCGGIALNEVNLKTMESRLKTGLFFAGEVLDIDGLTGGFNFQSAWTTGFLAGQGAAR